MLFDGLAVGLVFVAGLMVDPDETGRCAFSGCRFRLVIGDGQSHVRDVLRAFGSWDCSTFKLESLILAQNERWRQA